MRDDMTTYRFLVEKPEGNKPLGRPTRRWVDNMRIMMDLREMLVSAVINFRFYKILGSS
jgi:hypothetical protein